MNGMPYGSATGVAPATLFLIIAVTAIVTGIVLIRMGRR